MTRAHHKALIAIVRRMQKEHAMTFEDVLLAIDGDPDDVLREMNANAHSISRTELRRWIRDNETARQRDGETGRR